MGRPKQMFVELEIEGISPLLMDAMSEETVEDVLIRRKRSPVQTDLTREERCEPKFYRDPENPEAFGIPAENFMAALREAGRKVKVGKSQVSTAKTTTLYSFLSVRENFLRLTQQKWVPDVRRGRMDDGTTVGITRPKFPTWGFKVTLEVDLTEEGITENTIRELIRIAGNQIGLGAFRPQKNGPFGRFRITKWDAKEVVEETRVIAVA